MIGAIIGDIVGSVYEWNRLIARFLTLDRCPESNTPINYST